MNIASKIYENSKVDIKTPYVPTELIHDDNGITQVVIGDVKTEEKVTIDVDDVIVNYGFISSLGPIKEWGLVIDKNSIVVNSKMETNIPGIYARGDICTYAGKVKLIASGFGEAPLLFRQPNRILIQQQKNTVPTAQICLSEKG